MTPPSAERQSFKAICYKCKYKSFDPPADHKCPQCAFPLILQPQNQQSIKLNVRDIFDRTSVEVGPRLPGLGGENTAAPRSEAAPRAQVTPRAQVAPRAQVSPRVEVSPRTPRAEVSPRTPRAEVSPRAEMTTPRAHETAPVRSVAPRPDGVPDVAPAAALPSRSRRGRVHRLSMAVAFASAVVLGVVAAVVQGGL